MFNSKEVHQNVFISVCKEEFHVQKNFLCLFIKTVSEEKQWALALGMAVLCPVPWAWAEATQKSIATWNIVQL